MYIKVWIKADIVGYTRFIISKIVLKMIVLNVEMSAINTIVAKSLILVIVDVDRDKII